MCLRVYLPRNACFEHGRKNAIQGMELEQKGNEFSLFFVSPDKIVRPNKRQARSQYVSRGDGELGGDDDCTENYNSTAKKRRTPQNDSSLKVSVVGLSKVEASAKKAYDRHAAAVGISLHSGFRSLNFNETTNAQQRMTLVETTNKYVPSNKREPTNSNSTTTSLSSIPQPRLKRFPAPRNL